MAFNKSFKKAGNKPYEKKEPNRLTTPLFQFLTSLINISGKFTKVGKDNKLIAHLMLQPLADLGLTDEELTGLLWDIEKPSHVANVRYGLKNFIKYNEEWQSIEEFKVTNLAWANEMIDALPPEVKKKV
jgi:hypothetical protein